MRNRYMFTLALLAQTSLTSAAFAVDASALPHGGHVAHGSAGITQSGNRMNIRQHSDKAVINWQGFDVGRDASVRFHQPSSSSVALNRVVAGDASRIHGTISANGHVYLVNPSGVVFGDSARVDVGGLVASTHAISDSDFLAGKRVFRRNGATGKVVNKGEITAADGGDVVLIGSEVRNQGRITADGGNIALAAGEKVTLNAGANGHLQLAVDGATLDTLVANGGVLQADGGQVVMTSEAVSAAHASVVSNTGVVQARTLAHKKGRILLLADMEHGETKVGGLLDASAPDGGDGGFIETSAAKVTQVQGRTVTTRAAYGKSGTYLIDPQDYVIAASGGDMTGADLSADLENNGDVIIESVDGATVGNGDIFVRDTVNWTSDSTLTLRAENDILIERSITATGSNAGLVLEYGAGRDYYLNDGAGITLSGAAATLEIGGQAYTVVNDVAGLNAMTSGGFYAIGSDIDATSTNSGSGFDPRTLGNGQFHGLGNTIDGLFIDRPATTEVGLFASAGAGSVIRDIGLTNVDITGSDYIGGLVGALNGGEVFNAYTTGTILSSTFGSVHAGGLVGWNAAAIRDSHSSVNMAVTNGSSVGGLVGFNNGHISRSYATGNVTGHNVVGGLVGDANSISGLVELSYATGNVSGNNMVGGLIGRNYATVNNVYATGAVSGGDYVGGLIGSHQYNTLTHGYATGTVNGNIVGGLVGQIFTGFAPVVASFWQSSAGTTQAVDVDIDITELSAAQMRNISPYLNAGWSISSDGSATVWYIDNGTGTPQLRHFVDYIPPPGGGGGGGGNNGGAGSKTPGVDGGVLSLALAVPAEDDGFSPLVNMSDDESSGDEEESLLDGLLRLAKGFISI